MMKTKLLFCLAFLSIGMQAQNINFPDANFKQALLGGGPNNPSPNNFVLCYDSNGNNILADQNGDGEIQLSEAAQIYRIDFRQTSNYASLEGINSFANLETIYYINDSSNSHIHGKIGDVNLEGLSHLKTVNLSDCDVSKASFKNCPALSEVRSDFRDSYNTYPDPNVHGNTAELTINNCPKLNFVSWTNNNVASANIANTPELKHLELRGNSLTSFDASQLTNLEYLDLSNNQATWGPLTGEANFDPTLTSVNINGLTKLNYLNVSYQLLTDLYLNQLQLLETLSCNNNKITSLDLLYVPNLKSLNCSHNQISLIKNFSYPTSIADDDQLLDGPNYDFSYNQLTDMDINNMTANAVDLSHNLLSMINIYKAKMIKLNLSYNNFSDLDFSNSLSYMNEYLIFNNNPNLTQVFLKNGYNVMFLNDNDSYGFENTNIQFVCADNNSVELQRIQEELVKSGKTNVNINSYCSFTPGGNFNTISGNVKIDANNNGCDASDNPFEFLKLKINDGTTSGETFVQQNGKYEFYTQSGNFNITALAENPTLFTISPANFSTSFADSNNNVFTQDICVTANGTQNDAEVVIAPLTGARPGFDAVYQLVWRNKGNTSLTGKVVMNYDSNKMTFQSSNIPYSAISNGSIEFDFANLKPFENSAAELTFKINTPTDANNPVNMGDVLEFNAQIAPSNSDLTPDDNYFSYKQTVVNSFDPNDITCLEGETIPSVAVGKYMHYVVNFENTGNAEAENIVVKMDVDPAEFDINTLQLQNASAPVETRVVGNTVELIFKKIKLKNGGHGNVLLKMKSRSDLVEGDTVSNIADIYFDYNFPIQTNDYQTTIQDQNNVLAAKINFTARNFTQSSYAVNFDASRSTGNISSYQWEFSGNPSISSSNNIKPDVIYTVPGNYTAKLTVSDNSGLSSAQTVTFNVGANIADISTGKDSDNQYLAIDSDEDDWKGYDVNGTMITPKVRQTYPGWSYADLLAGKNSQWITLNNFEGYYTYKSREFTIPENATDAKLNLRSLSFVRNWTYLVKINPDGSETETEITKTAWMNDGAKGWLNSRSPSVNNYALSAGRYYIKVLLFSNNSTVRQSIDVNAIISCSSGLMYSNRLVQKQATLDAADLSTTDIRIYPVPTKGIVNIKSNEKLNSVEVYDGAGRIIQKHILSSPVKDSRINITSVKGIYYLKIRTDKGTYTRKVIKE